MSKKKKLKKSTTTHLVRCGHWRTPVHIGGYTVWASGLWDKPEGLKLVDAVKPDAGFYLDSSWGSRFGHFAGSGVNAPVQPPWPFLVVNWPDMSVLPDYEYAALVAAIIVRIKAGETVEIACLGGHGRTGSVLAPLVAHLEGRTAGDAITSLRARYCDKAVESASQVAAVYKVTGEEPPAVANGSKGDKWTGSWWNNQFDDEDEKKPLDLSGYTFKNSLDSEKTFELDEMPDWPAAYDQDICICECIRKQHRLLGAKCTSCGCQQFDLNEIVNA